MNEQVRLSDDADDLRVYKRLWREQELGGVGDIMNVGIELMPLDGDQLRKHLTEDACRKLNVFAKTESTGMLAVWRPRENQHFIVYLCDEGISNAVVGRSMREFVAAASACPDAVIYTEVSFDEIEANEELCEGYAESLRAFQAWVESEFEVRVPRTASEIMGPLESAAPDFDAWLAADCERFQSEQTSRENPTRSEPWWRRLIRKH